MLFYHHILQKNILSLTHNSKISKNLKEQLKIYFFQQALNFEWFRILTLRYSFIILIDLAH